MPMVKEVGRYPTYCVYPAWLWIQTYPHQMLALGLFFSGLGLALVTIRRHPESCYIVQLFWWGWSYGSAWKERTQISWQLGFISVTVDGTCYFIAQKKASILLERMKFTRETKQTNKKKGDEGRCFTCWQFNSETQENERTSPTFWIFKH